MDIFDKITISHFIWYLVPGMAMFFFLIMPMAIIDPSFAKSFFSALGPVGILFLAIIFGFFLDGLRLYRLKPKYKQIKNVFFQDLKDLISNDLDPYFIQSQISELAKEKKITGIGMHHAIWILHGHVAILTYIEGFFFLLYGVYKTGFFVIISPIFKVEEWSLLGASVDIKIFMLVMLSIGIFFIAIANRFEKISTEDQETTNKMFLDFARQFKDEIKRSLNI